MYFIFLGDSHWSFFSTWCWHLLKNLHLSRRILKFSNMRILQAIGYFTGYGTGIGKKQPWASFQGFDISSDTFSTKLLLWQIQNPECKVLLFYWYFYDHTFRSTSDPRFRGTRPDPPCGVTECVEILFLLCFVCDLFMKVTFQHYAMNL